MQICSSFKAISTFTLVLLMLIAAIVGGIIAYAFTIAAYVEFPQKTTIVITETYFEKKNATSFSISVLNPSYSPRPATISGIALSVTGGTQLYYATKTAPSIKDGLTVPIGEHVNITCLEIEKDAANIPFGEFAAEFTGETIIVHVFSPDSSASNIQTKLPLVKLDTIADFNPQISFKKFNMTLTNSAYSEVDLTVKSVTVSEIVTEEMTPNVNLQPETVPINGSMSINFKGNWYGLNKTMITVLTQEGYIFKKEVELKTVNVAIRNVTFNENNTECFNVTIFNSAESASYVTVKKVIFTLENGTSQAFENLSVDIMPGTEENITLIWKWDQHRGEIMSIVAYFAQDFETPLFQATISTP